MVLWKNTKKMDIEKSEVEGRWGGSELRNYWNNKESETRSEVSHRNMARSREVMRKVMKF